MRGNFGPLAESDSYGHADDEAAHETPPLAIGHDERRMQVRAYNHWASLLGDRNFPAIDDLEPANLPDFGPHSVLLDFTHGIEDPGVAYLGATLAEECGVSDAELQKLSDVPPRSLLTRITDHYMQILANQTPIGFEAEFVNQRGATLMYRGILLPYSSDDETIDFIYGVINWKVLPDARAADELLLEIDQALETSPAPAAESAAELSPAHWAEAPGAVPANDLADDFADDLADEGDAAARAGLADGDADNMLPMPSFGHGDASPEPDEDDGAFDLAAFELAALAFDDGEEEDGEDEDGEEEDDAAGSSYGSLLKMPLELSKSTEKVALALPEYDTAEMAFAELDPIEMAMPEIDPAEMGLGDWLAAAREMAAVANSSEDRTRHALYDAIGRAYDFSLAAVEAPEEFAELLVDAELTMQDRAPMTPVVKLVFGADYDKTRLTEYAAALGHAHRLQLPLGTLGAFLGGHEGGLKGVVNAERRLRKEESGKLVEPLDAPRQALARKLRALPAQDFAALDPAGCEFALVMIRRTDAGEVVMLGEVPDDVALVERAARRLLG